MMISLYLRVFVTDAMKTILVTGSNGMLGQKLVYKLCAMKEVQLIATSKGENRIHRKDGYVYEPLDISRKEEVEKIFLKHKPHVVINTAAMTNVDTCETHREECWAANVNAVQYMVEAAQNCHFIHVSTDFVFDGMKGKEYSEEDQPNPQSFYALSKYEGEKIVMAGKLKWAILRTIIVYGVTDGNTRSNLVLWVKSSLEKKQRINVITDQFRAPTLSEDLADACIAAALMGAEGIYHVSGLETRSIIDWAYIIASFWNLDRSYINPVTSAALNQPAKRPPYTGFVIEKAKRVLGYKPHSFREGLEIVDRELRAQRV
jgi:dTDP-4-dehydrorhamnose reductase